MNSRLVLMCGISGSGKTYFSKMLEKHGFVRLSADETAWRLSGEDFPNLPISSQKEILAKSIDELLALSIKHLQDGKAVVVDSTMCKRNKREQFRASVLQDTGIEPLIVYLNSPLHILRHRLMDRNNTGPNDQIVTNENLRTYFDNFERPSDNEHTYIINLTKTLPSSEYD